MRRKPGERRGLRKRAEENKGKGRKNEKRRFQTDKKEGGKHREGGEGGYDEKSEEK